MGQVNRATAESSQARAIAEGLAPLQKHMRVLMNRIIQRDMGFAELEFAWQDTRQQDPREAAQIDVAYVSAGILTADEVRDKMGLKAIKGKNADADDSKVEKFNPHHDDRGRFTTADNAVAPGYDELPGLMPREFKEDEFEVVADNGTSSDAKFTYPEQNAIQYWENPKTLDKHVKRHGSDFGTSSPKEYVKKASEFLDYAKKNKLPMVEYGNGSEIGVYDPKTNTFGVYSKEGKVKSFYKPERPNYFQNQIKRAETGGGRIINAMPQPLMPEEIRGGRGGGGGAPVLLGGSHSPTPQRIKDENN